MYRQAVNSLLNEIAETEQYNKIACLAADPKQFLFTGSSEKTHYRFLYPL